MTVGQFEYAEFNGCDHFICFKLEIPFLDKLILFTVLQYYRPGITVKSYKINKK